MMNSGLQDNKYKLIRDALNKDAINILNVSASTEGHLGNIIACIRTTVSSLELKADQLTKIFNDQKSEPTTDV